MADKYPSWSSYNYTLNNPLKYIDPNGLESHNTEGETDEEEEERKRRLREQQEQQEQTSVEEAITIATSIFANSINSVLYAGEYFAETAKDVADLSKAGKFTSVLGRITGVTQLGISIDQAIENPSTGNILKVLGSGGLVLVKNPYVLIGSGILDVTGISDDLYNDTGKLIDRIYNDFHSKNLESMFIFLKSGGLQK